MDIEDLGYLARKPKVTNYNPCTIRNLKPGSIKEWCTCGLTKKGPWCDGKSHKGTSFKPLRWKVPDGKNTQTMYSICDCRYTTIPPFCDGIHYDLPLRYLKKIQECPKQPHDPAVTKLCEECGWAGPRESWPELPPTDSDEDTDITDSDEESEETKAKRLAANSPKVQVQLQGQKQEQDQVNPDSMDLTSDVSEPRFACNGSCQIRGTQDDAEVGEVTEEIKRVQL
ncbi:hypothetical protein BGZ80_000908 [Entomortierella chlamydospora]|uniref:Iron-binding zinc finger CDGSH type domain-containing protein n=1 Tax=Entomortierella chlamydospora TaxID=101097 RepID=A0A9P6N3G7_9FUNG|nr:hypothetical protein BGZ79_005594 [Entomortierella chlamydospora]KAG0022153.1 hypothetical protein BGZ80_000908 [Entomortierella chlamydospora]